MNTKIWVVEGSSMFSFNYSGSPVGFFLSKQEAEFFAWTKNKEQSRESIRSRFYTVQEISSLAPVSDPKKYKEFLKDKIAEATKEFDEMVQKEEASSQARNKAYEVKTYYQNLLDAVK